MKRKGNASLLLWRRWSCPESVMFTKAQKKADVVWLICILCALSELVNISGKIHSKHACGPLPILDICIHLTTFASTDEGCGSAVCAYLGLIVLSELIDSFSFVPLSNTTPLCFTLLLCDPLMMINAGRIACRSLRGRMNAVSAELDSVLLRQP